MNDAYASLSEQFEHEMGEFTPAWTATEEEERWDVDIDALKKEFDV